MNERQEFDHHPDSDTVRLIVDQIKCGDEDAWRDLVQHLQDHLTLMAQRNLSPVIKRLVNPSDIVQQSLLQVVKGIGDFKGSTRLEFYAWLNQIIGSQATRFARDLTRQKRDVRKQFSLQSKHHDSSLNWAIADRIQTPQSNAIAKERLELMEQALSRLPVDYERVIRMRSFDDRSNEEIAMEMNRTATAVAKLWYRAIVKLREELARVENEAEQQTPESSHWPRRCI